MEIDDYNIVCYRKYKQVDSIELYDFEKSLLEAQLKEGHIVFLNEFGETEIININSYDKIKIISKSAKLKPEWNYLYIGGIYEKDV